MKRIIWGIAFLCTISLLMGCVNEELLKKQQQESEEETKKENARKDTLNTYLNIADSVISLKKYALGASYLDSAMNYTIFEERDSVIVKLADANFRAKNYEKAFFDFSSLINSKINLPQNYFLRAICNHKQGKIEKAVSDLKEAIELGNKEAEAFHNKINPLKRRVAYYVTRCCDGTTSDAKGRGACSHHDGVCDWNDPVYEEYRRY